MGKTWKKNFKRKVAFARKTLAALRQRERERERKKERKKEEDRRERVINSRSVRRLKLELFATLRVVSFRVRFPFLLPSVVFDHTRKVFASARLDVFFFLLFKGFA